MIEEGEQAPDFRLPAVVDGERREVGLADHLDERVVVLGFYPGDFNPACDGQSTDLDDLDLFTMQKDVAVLGISGDSVHSHRAFAAEYDLQVPLLADVHGEVTEAYGVGADEPGSLTRRAVVVVDPEGTVRYAWAAESSDDLPDVDRVRAAVEGVGGGEMALARYRVGHAHYVEGRRAFSSAMGGFEDREWLLAKHDFAQAEGEFGEAADQFDTAARFAGSDDHRTHYERAGRKAEELSRAAEWLARSAGAFASGEGREGEQLRTDAETPLETAREVADPVPPDEFPPGDSAGNDAADGRVGDEPGAGSPPEPTGGPGASGEADGPAAHGEPAAGSPAGGASAPGTEAEAGGGFTRSASSDGRGAAGGSDEDERRLDGDDRIDETELEEITAELEEQSRAGAGESGDGASGGNGGGAAGVEEGEVELDLTDPTGDEDTESSRAEGDDTGPDSGDPDSP
jgi:peroxiredoxin